MADWSDEELSGSERELIRKTKPSDGEFNVCQFFEDGSHEYVRRNVDPETAVKAAKHYTESVGARMGMTKRVIITDGGDCVNFEWQFGKGVTFK